jgi:hypothetical protein
MCGIPQPDGHPENADRDLDDAGILEERRRVLAEAEVEARFLRLRQRLDELYAESAEVDKDFAELEPLVGLLRQDTEQIAAARSGSDNSLPKPEKTEDQETPQRHGDEPPRRSRANLRLALVGSATGVIDANARYIPRGTADTGSIRLPGSQLGRLTSESRAFCRRLGEVGAHHSCREHRCVQRQGNLNRRLDLIEVIPHTHLFG